MVHSLLILADDLISAICFTSWVDGRSLLLGQPAADPGEPANKEMNVDSYLDTLTTPIPQGKDLKPFIDLIFETCQEIRKRFNAPPHIVDQEADAVLYLSFMASKPDDWIRRFKDAKNKAAKFWTNPRTYWKTLALAEYTPAIEKECREFIPSFNPEKYLNKPTAPPAPQKITPPAAPTPSTETRPKKLIPRVPKRRFPTVTEYILFYAPSNSYELVYSTTLGCTKNKLSSRGKKVYPYGQPYIAKLTRLSLRTVVYAWSWLRKQGIFNKARNENPEKHHCALWYVCTAMKQIPYFRDPKNLHRKTKRKN